jgi:hypothetical protein
MPMTEAKLREICKQNDLFLTPAANDKLYANNYGFRTIGGLDKYTGLKCLFLEGNGLDSLAGLPPLPQLRTLWVHVHHLRVYAYPNFHLDCMPSWMAKPAIRYAQQRRRDLLHP